MKDLIWQTPNPVLVALLTLGLVMHLIVVARSDRPLTHKMALSVLNVVFGLFLWLFLQPPSHPNIQDILTLITPGATEAELHSARRARTTIAIGEHLSGALDERRITTHLDLASVRLSHPQATTLNVLGAGLDKLQWNADRTWNVNFAAPAPIAGLRQVHWPRRIEAGNPFVVSGRITNMAPASVQLIDPAGDIAERADVGADGIFSLTDNTRSPGRFLYRIELTTSSADVIESQAVPVHVVEPEPIDLLVLLSAPSFESRYLKNWAGRGGARLAIRTTISEERFLNEFVGRDAMPLDRLDRSSLASFDVIVADQRAWRTLDTTARNMIATVVEQDGLGLAVMALDAEQTPVDKGHFPLLVPGIARNVALAVKDASSTASTVTLAAANFSNELARDNVILRDISGLPVVAAKPLGKGRVGVTLVTDSHKLVTAGNFQQHARYWRTLIHAMAPSNIRPGSEIWPSLPLVDQRVQMCVFGSPLANEAVINESMRVALRPQAYRPGEHCGYWWPDRIGWHTLTMGNTIRDVYVFDTQDWQGLHHANATSATLLAAQREPSRERAQLSPDEPRLLTFPRWPLAILLLLVAALLWLEQKLRDG